MAKRKLHGSALFKRIEKQLRETLARDWGLPIEEYDCDICNIGSGDVTYAFDPDMILFAKFTRVYSGNPATRDAIIRVDSIYHDDDGNLTQYLRPELG